MQLYQIGKSIGIGSFGQVYLAWNKHQEKQYVIKRIPLRDINAKQRQHIETQLKLLQKLRHPNIVAFKDSFRDREDCLNIVMVYCQGGDMYNKIKLANGKNFSESAILEWIVQMCLALYYIHDQKILHRDLKTQNIFLKHDRVRLGDFGISKVLDSTKDLANTQIGTPYYMSPQLFKNKPYSYKSDIWALGCVIYQMCNMRIAFDAQNVNALAIKIFKGQYPEIISKYSKSLRQLVGCMLKINPKERPTIYQILSKPIIQRRVVPYIQEMLSRINDQKFTDLDDIFIDSLKIQSQKLGIVNSIKKHIPDESIKFEQRGIEEKAKNLQKLIKKQVNQKNILENKLKKLSSRQKMMEYAKRNNKKRSTHDNSKRQASKSNDKKSKQLREKRERQKQAVDHRHKVLRNKQKKKLQQEQRYKQQSERIAKENVALNQMANSKKQAQYRTSQEQNIHQNKTFNKLQQQFDMFAQQQQQLIINEDPTKTIQQLQEQYEEEQIQGQIIKQQRALLKTKIYQCQKKINQFTQKLQKTNLINFDQSNQEIASLLNEQQGQDEQQQQRVTPFELKINQRIRLLKHRVQAGVGNVLYEKAYQKVQKSTGKSDQLRGQLVDLFGQQNIGYWHIIKQIISLNSFLKKKLDSLKN